MIKSIGSLKNVKAMIFVYAASYTGPNHEYIVGIDDMDYIEFLKQYASGGSVDAKRATGCNMDSDDNEFWLCAVADCFDPPIAIVRASVLEEAIDICTEECGYAKVDAADIGKIEFSKKDQCDYLNGDHVEMNDNGTWYYSDDLHAVQVILKRIEFDV